MERLRSVASHCSIPDDEDLKLFRHLTEVKLKIERKRSFDERSLCGQDYLDGVHAPGPGRAGFNTPHSLASKSFESHRMVADATEAL